MNDRPERDIRAWSVASWDNRVRDVDKSVSYGANNKDSRRIGGLREDNIDCTVANNRRDWMTSRLNHAEGMIQHGGILANRKLLSYGRHHLSRAPISFIKEPSLVRDSESWIFGPW